MAVSAARAGGGYRIVESAERIVLCHRRRVVQAAAETYARGIVGTLVEPTGENTGQVVHDSGEQLIGGEVGAVGAAELAQPERQAMTAGELHAGVHTDPSGV